MYLLTELVRLLEQRGYPLPANPARATEILRQAAGSPEERLHRRAKMIDRGGNLAARLNAHARRTQALLSAAGIAWFLAGFGAAYGLMGQGSLNFLLLLVGALGANTAMLLAWLVSLALRKPAHLPAAWLWGSLKTPEGQAWAELYAEAARRPHFRWRTARTAHRLALCALFGLSAACALLLGVRQYRFNWESTLFSETAFAKLTAALAWLPEKLGFPVPSEAAVAAARNAGDAAHAAQWAWLLLGSLLCYGILPRALAWLACVWQQKRHPLRLDLSLPYYQNIMQQWQRRITDDAADYRADAPAAAPKILPDAAGAHWAVLLDAPDAPANWFVGVLGQEWADKGSVETRDELARLLAALAAEPVQLLVGIRAHSAPDRGTVRRLAQCAQAAQSGMAVQLLGADDAEADEAAQELARQWRETLRKNGWMEV